jgi:YVTN family beta-propeller protein
VSVVDATPKTISGSPIKVGTGPAALAVSPDGKQVYVGNNSDALAVIDTTTRKRVFNEAVGGINALALSPDGTGLFAASQTQNTVSVIDTTIPITGIGADTVVASVPVERTPAAVVVSRDGRSVYVPNRDDSSVSVISVPTA